MAGIWARDWDGGYSIEENKIEKGRCGWLDEFRQSHRLSSTALFSSPMADSNPPPLFSPTEAKTDISDTGNVVIFHGEIFSDPEITLAHIHVRADPDPGTANETTPPLPDNEPGEPVRPRLSPTSTDSDHFVQSPRTLNQMPPLVLTLSHTTLTRWAASRRKLYVHRTFSLTSFTLPSTVRY